MGEKIINKGNKIYIDIRFRYIGGSAMTCLFFNDKGLYLCQRIFLSLKKQHVIHVFVANAYEKTQLPRIRSPPSNLDLKKIQIGGKDMEGNRPKRRKDKYNPYTIFEKDGQGALHKFEISKALYDTFDSFELSDLVYLNVVDRHIEQSEVWENTLNMRAMKKPDSMEEIVFRRFQAEKLHKAINELPEKQKKRLILHYFQELTYVEIAEREKCSTRAVEYSIHGAIQSLKKFFEKN